MKWHQPLDANGTGPRRGGPPRTKRVRFGHVVSNPAKAVCLAFHTDPAQFTYALSCSFDARWSAELSEFLLIKAFHDASLTVFLLLWLCYGTS